MKEIIKGAVVIDPTFRSKMTLVMIKKIRVFVMSLKINQRKMISLRQGAKLHVKILACRLRYSLLIVNVARDWHTEQQRLRMKLCERTQEQFQIDPALRCIHVASKCHILTTERSSFVQTRSSCNLLRVGSFGSAYACDKLWPIGRFPMGLRGRLDLMPNVIERRKMVLTLHYDGLYFSERPQRAENNEIKPPARSQPF